MNEKNEKYVNINDFKKEAKRRKREEVINKYVKAPAYVLLTWAANNPVEAVGACAALIPITSRYIRYRQIKAEDRRKATRFYDTRCGRNVRIKRPLTVKEQVEVDRRFKLNKESYTSIFYDMGILKKQ